MAEYPVSSEEFEGKVIEFYLKRYPEDRKAVILERLEGLIKKDDDFIKEIYEHTCFRYGRKNLPDDCSDRLKYRIFMKLGVNTLQMHIGGDFDSTDDLSSLKKVERNFHILIEDFFLIKNMIGDYDYHLPELREDCFDKEEFHRVPGMYGGFFYILKLEDGKPVLHANASSRMDLDEDYIIDEICYIWIKSTVSYGK